VGLHLTTAQLTVENTGPPIPPYELPGLFEPFRRLPATERLADATTTSTGRGAGLGLSIVRSVAYAHGGDVHAAPSRTAASPSACGYLRRRSSPSRTAHHRNNPFAPLGPDRAGAARSDGTSAVGCSCCSCRFEAGMGERPHQPPDSRSTHRNAGDAVMRASRRCSVRCFSNAITSPMNSTFPHYAEALPEALGVAESLLEQVAQLPWEATVGGLSAPAGRRRAPACARYLRSGRFWIAADPRPTYPTTCSR